ncbi:hypothetical protein Moror_14869 [Moniliophthora roreri MCA 2997]|uniref:Uncharacterized protein n=1 Tax=Moniliophthora roreri (strain MCA 2997) TaxID=1381753 RepID=V2WKX8_MONRO|nr:hypothetical protein Moror_14869 [Moniliophthora roreri MCA 2997]
MTIDLTELKKTLSNVCKFLPEKAFLGVMVDNFCHEAFNSLAGLSNNDMLAVSKNHKLIELCITVFKEVTYSSVQNVIDDQVCKSVSDNVLYLEQLADGMHKPDKSASTEPSVHPIEAKSLSKADVKDFLTDIEKSGEEEPAPCTCSCEKGKEKMPAKTEKRVKDPKDSMEPHKAEHEACHPDQSSCSNSVPPASADTDMAMADMAKNIDHMETELHSFWAMDKGSLFCTMEELQQELLLLPFRSMEAKSTLTLMSLYNAATAALASHLFSAHKAMQDYKNTLVTHNEISRILCDCHITLLSPQAYDTKDIDMPMVQ